MVMVVRLPEVDDWYAIFSMSGDTWMVSPEVAGKLVLGTWYRYMATGKMLVPNGLVFSAELGSYATVMVGGIWMWIGLPPVLPGPTSANPLHGD